MKRITFILLAILLLTMPGWATITPASAATTGQGSNCLFFTETVEGGERGFSVCDDQEASFRTPLLRYNSGKQAAEQSLRSSTPQQRLSSLITQY